jgi:hypothetical protein
MHSALQGLIVASGLITLHAPDGHEVFINASEVTTLHQRMGAGKGTYTPDAACMINTTDGKFITVIENCLEVINTIRGAQQ